jgi:hypothetical protein
MLTSAGVVRGSGVRRKVGRLYIEVGLEQLGMPLGAYILDPVFPVHEAAFQRFDQGEPTMVRDTDRVWHVVDVVSQEQYPFATDFLEEARAKGISRHIPRSLGLELLTPGRSTILFLHRRGYLDNWYEFQDAEVDAANDVRCRAVALAGGSTYRPSVHSHFGASCVEHCSRHLWSATASTQCTIGATPGGGSSVTRAFTDLVYTVYPAGALGRLVHPRWCPGFIARFPITNFVRIRGTGGLISSGDPDRRLSKRYPVYRSLP